MSKNLGRWMILVAVTTLLVALLIAGQGLAQNDLTDEELLGEFLYFDENLSEPAGQSCASCHLPKAGFVDPDKGLPVSEGVITEPLWRPQFPRIGLCHVRAHVTTKSRTVDRRPVLGRPGHRRSTGRSAGRPGSGSVPEPGGDEQSRQGRPSIADALGGDYADLFIEVCGDGSERRGRLRLHRVVDRRL